MYRYVYIERKREREREKEREMQHNNIFVSSTVCKKVYVYIIRKTRVFLFPQKSKHISMYYQDIC